MNSSKLKIDTRVRSLKAYIDEFENGVFQIPSFQRDFLWSVDRIKQLFDSVKNSYPIGSIMFWEPMENAENWISDRPIGPYKVLNPQNNNPIFILDGYQRLSSLFGCMINPKRYNKNKLKFDKTLWKEKFEIFYDLEEEEFVSLRKGGKKTALQVPIYTLMSAADFRKYARENIENIEDEEKIDTYLDRADQLAEVLNNYQIASIDIKNASIEEAIEIFRRVNEEGMLISKDWVVNALTNRNDFNLQSEIDVLVENLKQYNFNKIKRDLLFNCIQSSFGKLYLYVKVEKLVNNPNFVITTKRAIKSIEKAIKFMYEELYVVSHKILPTNWHLIFITEFFNLVEEPSENQKDMIKNWFWYTTYSNYFTVYNPSKRNKAFIQFREYFLNNEKGTLVYDEEPEVKFISPKFKNTNKRSVRYCANILFQFKISNSSESINVDNYEGFSELNIFNKSLLFLSSIIKSNDKLLDETKEFANTIFMLNKIVVDDFREEKHRNYSFLLSDKYRDKYENLFLTNRMRDEFKREDYNNVIEMRFKLIQKEEKEFVESLGLEYEEV